MKKARLVIKLNDDIYYSEFTYSTSENSAKEEFLNLLKEYIGNCRYFKIGLEDGSTLFLSGENFNKAVFIVEESAE